MKKIEDGTEVREWIQERFQLSAERIDRILAERGQAVAAPFDDYFYKTAEFIRYVEQIHSMRKSGIYARLSLAELKAVNYRLYEDILPGDGIREDILPDGCCRDGKNSSSLGYGSSYANPDYSCRMLGSEMGPLLAWLVTEVRGLILLAFQDRLADMTAINELFIEIYNCFEQGQPDAEEIKKIIYWYVSDYSDQTVTRWIRESMDPSLSFYRDIIMESDLTDLSYLYQYGSYISENERKIAAYLNSLDADVIESMAATFTEGYVRGFEIYRIDLSAKKYVQLRANMGFERVLRAAVRQFEAMGLEVIVPGEAIHSVNKRAGRRGFLSCSPNPQYDYDHRMDRGLYLDKAMSQRILDVTKAAYEQYKELAALYAGPAVMEVFGETPFEPVVKETAVRMTDRQEKLWLRLVGQMSDVSNQYIVSSTTSFTIIAWPLPSIGKDFEAIMDATVAVNNLDNDTFRQIQQRMIDAMDGAAYMKITGDNGNRTDLQVALWQLNDPEKETVFENCCADVNIPVGEVFTSPVLKGTHGRLHVSGVYLGELYYRNLSLTFEDGCIVDYDCSNYEDGEKNRAYIRQNLLQNRDTLPLGEFAIGTNTTAYAMARQFQIGHLMPILIMEKTGPHFAVGDTCYSHMEDYRVYNPDGKEIVARENERSALRKEDTEKAYFNVHTDITIPYDEIGAITACFADGRQVDIIRNGRFCLAGTEKLNEALDRA